MPSSAFGVLFCFHPLYILKCPVLFQIFASLLSEYRDIFCTVRAQRGRGRNDWQNWLGFFLLPFVLATRGNQWMRDNQELEKLIQKFTGFSRKKKSIFKAFELEPRVSTKGVKSGGSHNSPDSHPPRSTYAHGPHPTGDDHKLIPHGSACVCFQNPWNCWNW